MQDSSDDKPAAEASAEAAAAPEPAADEGDKEEKKEKKGKKEKKEKAKDDSGATVPEDVIKAIRAATVMMVSLRLSFLLVFFV